MLFPEAAGLPLYRKPCGPTAPELGSVAVDQTAYQDPWLPDLMFTPSIQAKFTPSVEVKRSSPDPLAGGSVAPRGEVLLPEAPALRPLLATP